MPPPAIGATPPITLTEKRRRLPVGADPSATRAEVRFAGTARPFHRSA